jgi:hypothetical protein
MNFFSSLFARFVHIDEAWLIQSWNSISNRKKQKDYYWFIANILYDSASVTEPIYIFDRIISECVLSKHEW